MTMTIDLITTSCDELEKNLVELLCSEAGHSRSPESEVLQRRFHIASCAQCFERAKPLIKNPRPYCERLWIVVYHAYATGTLPADLHEKYRAIIDGERLMHALARDAVDWRHSAQSRKRFAKHLDGCVPCTYWLKVLANGWTEKTSSGKSGPLVE